MSYDLSFTKIISFCMDSLEIELENEDFFQKRSVRGEQIPKLMELKNLILFVYTLDVVREPFNYEYMGIYKLSRYAKKYMPYSFLCCDLGLITTYEEDGNNVDVKETGSDALLFLKVFRNNINNQKILNSYKRFSRRIETENPVNYNYFLDQNFFINNENFYKVEHNNDICIFLNNLADYYINSDEYNLVIKSRKYYWAKYRRYCDYLGLIIQKSDVNLIFCISFYIEDGGSGNVRSRLPEIKSKFFNSLRNNSAFSGILGYMGFWELIKVSNFGFKVWFVFKNDKDDFQALRDSLIYYWENIFLSNLKKSRFLSEGNNVAFVAKECCVLQSCQKLNKDFIVIRKSNKKLVSLFCDHVISYIVLSELFYFPYELQMYLYYIDPNFDSKDEKKERKVIRAFRGG